MEQRKGRIIIPAGVSPWPHEFRVAKILAAAGYVVEFLPTNTIKTADIKLDDIEFEIKSPLTEKANTLEHMLKRALRQSPNIIIDSSRTNSKKIRDDQICRFLINKARQHKQIKRMLLITRGDKIIDILSLI